MKIVSIGKLEAGSAESVGTRTSAMKQGMSSISCDVIPDRPSIAIGSGRNREGNLVRSVAAAGKIMVEPISSTDVRVRADVISESE